MFHVLKHEDKRWPFSVAIGVRGAGTRSPTNPDFPITIDTEHTELRIPARPVLRAAVADGQEITPTTAKLLELCCHSTGKCRWKRVDAGINGE